MQPTILQISPIFLLLLLAVPVHAQDKTPTTLREVLLSELRSTHTSAEWFVPSNIAVKGLTAEQANWTDGKGNHSVGQLAYHLVFWNRRNLARLKGENLERFDGNKDEAFDKFDSKTWNETVKQLAEVMGETRKMGGNRRRGEVEGVGPSVNSHQHPQCVPHRPDHLRPQGAGSWDPKNGVNCSRT